MYIYTHTHTHIYIYTYIYTNRCIVTYLNENATREEQTLHQLTSIILCNCLQCLKLI